MIFNFLPYHTKNYRGVSCLLSRQYTLSQNSLAQETLASFINLLHKFNQDKDATLHFSEDAPEDLCIAKLYTAEKIVFNNLPYKLKENTELLLMHIEKNKIVFKKKEWMCISLLEENSSVFSLNYDHTSKYFSYEKRDSDKKVNLSLFKNSKNFCPKLHPGFKLLSTEITNQKNLESFPLASFNLE